MDDMETTTHDTIHRSTFLAEAVEAATHNDSSAEGFHFDGEIAWEHYAADPARWHRTSQDDNPEGNPVLAMVLTDGPWWVPSASR